VAPAHAGNQWQWVVSGAPAIKKELDMPPHRRVAGQMIVIVCAGGRRAG